MKRYIGMALLISILLISACSPYTIETSAFKKTSIPTTELPTATNPHIPLTDTTIPSTNTPVPPTDTTTPLPANATPIPPTATSIPTQTNTPTTSPEELLAIHDSDYTYIVYLDISPGTWCPLSLTSDCYWLVYYPGRVYYWFGSGRGCMTISQPAEVVDWYSLCGPWEFKRFEDNQTPITDLPLSDEELIDPRKPGDYLIEVHLYSGVWKIEVSKYCEWTIYDLMSETLEWKRASSGTLNLVGKANWVKLSNDYSQMIFLHN